MTADHAEQRWSFEVSPRTGDRDPRPVGGSRGLVWSKLAAEMRTEARAAGDDRFERLDARSRVPKEATPIPLERLLAACRPRSEENIIASRRYWSPEDDRREAA